MKTEFRSETANTFAYVDGMNDIEFKWEENIMKAKQLYVGRNKTQMEIARLALEVCEITRGGGSARNGGLFTLQRFAKEVGVHPKSLSQWISVRKLVFEKLPAEKSHGANYSDMAYVAMRVKPHYTKKEVETRFDEITKEDMSRTILKYISTIRSIVHNFKNNNARVKTSKKVLRELKFYVKMLDRHLYDIDPLDSNLVSVNNIKNISCINTILGNDKNNYIYRNGSKIKINDRDRETIKFLKRQKKYMTVKEVVSNISGQETDNAKKCSVIRTIQKLHALKYIHRNTKGHYLWSANK